MAKFIGLCAVLLACSASLFAKDKVVLPKSVVVARYVMVTSYYGNRVADPRIPSDDRRAIADVENALHKWGKYIVVYHPENADIIVLVRKGRLAMVTPHIGIGTGVGIDTSRGTGGIEIGGNRRTTTTTMGVGAEAGEPDDMIAVYDAMLGTDAAPLWRESMRDGLNPPGMKLVQEFRKVVDEAAKKP